VTTPTTISIANWLEDHAPGQCLDARADAHRVSLKLANRYAPSKSYHAGLYDALMDKLDGVPYCTDNHLEVEKIARLVHSVLSTWGPGLKDSHRRRTRRRATRRRR